MKNWKQVKEISGTTFGLVLISITFSQIIGWNLMSVLIFWFLIVPLVSLTIPYLIHKKKQHQMQSIIGMMLFYAIMVLMIYEQSATDYFKIMVVSGIVNLALIFGLYSLKNSLLFRRNKSSNGFINDFWRL